ncbi:hypothetical protein K474DRAFT_1700146 [Panus rudis PR-1116 ss-1]|nr:hypothetical protein K474DRAFT_1700146 [Panus rudis PR-1116 ss-1]
MSVERGPVAAGKHNLPTPNTSPAHNSLLPPFGSTFISQLPTPQSPTDIGAYDPSHSLNPNTPSQPRSQLDPNPSAAKGQPLTTSSQRQPPVASFLTPESSPLSRKVRPARPFRTPSPSRTPQAGTFAGRHSEITQTTNSPTTPVFQSRELSPPSLLSSPFQPSTNPVTPNKRSRAATPRDTPVMVQDMLSSNPSTSSNPLPSLQAPVPHRPVVSDLERMRLQLEAEKVARQNEAEARRPEYLKRTKRPFSSLDDPNFFDLPPDKENDMSTLGVTESPMKGRRLTLFTETSEESFEQSLSASGYLRYGSVPAYGNEPQTPQKATLSQKAMEWLQQATPGRPLPAHIVAANTEEHVIPSEKEMKKRRRLAAFEDSPSRSPPRKLYPVELEGRGRVLLDQPINEPAPHVEAAAKQRSPRKGKGKATKKRGQVAEDTPKEPEMLQPNWPDNEFPWSMRARERAELAKLESAERLKWIERFLDRDTDDEDEDGDDQALGPPVTPEPDDDDVAEDASTASGSVPSKATHNPGRGKMVPLKSNHLQLSSAGQSKKSMLLIPSDPADARAALLSKRSVRALAFRRKLERSKERDSDEDDVVCVCNGRDDDGRELVQCDDCRMWYHLECIGIKDISELGKEEDPWYCHRCLDLPTPSASEPTFVPTDDRPLQEKPHDPLFFQGALQASPTTPWSASRTPRTPLQRGRNLTEEYPSTRSTFDDSSSVTEPKTPVSSARSTRIHRTPLIFDGQNSEESPFDPTSTPSRGIRFTGPFTTPKEPGWTTRNGLMQTPSRAKKPSSAGSNLDESPHFAPRTVYSYEDTPVQRSIPKERRGRASYRHSDVPDSPLSSRAMLMRSLELEDSPLMRFNAARERKAQQSRANGGGGISDGGGVVRRHGERAVTPT